MLTAVKNVNVFVKKRFKIKLDAMSTESSKRKSVQLCKSVPGRISVYWRDG